MYLHEEIVDRSSTVEPIISNYDESLAFLVPAFTLDQQHYNH